MGGHGWKDESWFQEDQFSLWRASPRQAAHGAEDQPHEGLRRKMMDGIMR
jgi:hypothetical protein